MERSAGQAGRVVLILGMHRSGTSAVARVANLLGAELGRELVPPGPDNPRGFWEHAEVVRINDELLHGLQRTWYQMRDLPEGWIDSPQARFAATRIGDLIDRDFGAGGLCAVKDPRMCLTAPLWIEAFQARGIDAACLFVVRDPGEVVASLHRRNDWPRAPLYLMWVQYLMAATAASERRRRAMLTYDQLLSDWRGSMTRVARHLRLCWPAETDRGAADRIDAFLDAGHRHHRVPRHAAAAGADTPELAAKLYQACLRIASGEGQWGAISAFQGAYRELGQLHAAHVEQLLGERREAEQRAQAAEARAAEQGSAGAAVRDAVRGLQEQLDARLGSLERNVQAIGQHARVLEDGLCARMEAQASATAAIHCSLRQLQDEAAAVAGETAARFERQREAVRAVEARIQRQHALLNTISLRQEQAGAGRGERTLPGAGDALPQTDLQKLRSALADSNATVAALLTSTSWKLTAPMRWLSVHLLRRPPDLGVAGAPGAAVPAPPQAPSAGAVGAGTGAAAGPPATPAAGARSRRGRGSAALALRWIEARHARLSHERISAP